MIPGDPASVARLVNGLLTIACGAYLWKRFAAGRVKRPFALWWCLGFLLYGAQILLQIPLESTNPAVMIMSVVAMGFFAMGSGAMIEKIHLFLGVYGGLLGAAFILFYVAGLSTAGAALDHVPLLLPTVALAGVRLRYGTSSDLSIVGWSFIFLVDIFWHMELVGGYVADLLTAFGKIVVLGGLMDPRFAEIALRVDKLMTSSGPQPRPQAGASLHFILVEPTMADRRRDLEWLDGKAREDIQEGAKVMLLVLYDMISDRQLVETGLMDLPDFYLGRMSSQIRYPSLSLDKRLILIPDDLTSLGRLLNEIAEASRLTQGHFHVVLYSLSWLIETHGASRVYRLLVDKMPLLKQSEATLYAFLYREAHSQPAEVELVESLADEVRVIK